MNEVMSWWRERLAPRPMWMNALMVFCAYAAAIYVPWDLLAKPLAEDREVWFGVSLYGAWAKLTAPLHGAIYAAGAYGFWRMRSWMWPWAAVYTAQVAAGMWIWAILEFGGLRGWVGGCFVGLPFAGLALALWNARERFESSRPPLAERYGTWALVTGASAGIGAELARAAASQGMSVVLVARRRERLERLAAELKRIYRVETRILVADLAVPGAADDVVAGCADLEIALLANNAGFGLVGRFEGLPAERLAAMVQVNCRVPTVLARAFLPGMVERGRGAVIFTGSLAGKQPVPYHSLYAATKAFDNHLAEGLWAELRGSGVDVLSLEPGATETEFQQVADEIAHPGESAADVVETALAALGRQPSVVSGWGNWCNGQLHRLLPRSLTALIAKGVMSAWTPPERRGG